MNITEWLGFAANIEWLIDYDKNFAPAAPTSQAVAYNNGYLAGGEDRSYRGGVMRKIPANHRECSDVWKLGWNDGASCKYMGYSWSAPNE